MTSYHGLFEPLRLGPLTLRNRIVCCAHLTNYAVDGLPSEQHAAYYAARAAGGAGLIISEEHTVHPSDRAYEKLIRGFDPAVIPGYRRITNAVHAHGTPILAQLNHNGGQGSSRYSQQPLWAPSAVPDPLFREVPKAIEEPEIAELIAGYALVAGHIVEGGFDGVELQCSQSSILAAFLSPTTNRRTDGYGGSLTNRARLLLAVVRTVRTVLGPTRALGVRLGVELLAGGTSLDEAVEVARMLDAAGEVDYLSTSLGSATSSLHMIEASMRVPAGYALFIPSAIRAAVAIPVLGVGRFTDPAQAEQAITAGHCDLVGVVRGQIADPDFATKARAGQAETIRTCLSCNQECIGRVGHNRSLGCLENPRAGHEATPLPPPSRRGMRVFVVGAGPAGLQAALTAAQRGHRVTLLERGQHSGGQVLGAANAPGRAGFAELARNLTAAATLAGVELRTGHDVTARWLLEQEPDAVVLATGARPHRPHWAAPELTHVVDVRDVLEGREHPAGDVLVVDELGFHHAPSVAEFLAGRGCRVRVMTNAMIVGQDLGTTLDLEHWNVQARVLGIGQLTDRVVLAATADAGLLRVDVLVHPTGVVEPHLVDWVVCAVQAAPVDELWKELREAPFPVHRAGDCLTPRRAQAAVIEGERVAAGLDQAFASI